MVHGCGDYGQSGPQQGISTEALSTLYKREDKLGIDKIPLSSSTILPMKWRVMLSRLTK